MNAAQLSLRQLLARRQIEGLARAFLDLAVEVSRCRSALAALEPALRSLSKELPRAPWWHRAWWAALDFVDYANDFDDHMRRTARAWGYPPRCPGSSRDHPGGEVEP